MSETEQICIEPAGAESTRNYAVDYCAVSIDHQHQGAQEKHRGRDMFGFHMKSETPETPRNQIEFRQNRRVSDHHRGDAAARRIEKRLGRHDKQMPQLAANRAAHEQV